jgi:hypothetical protein
MLTLQAKFLRINDIAGYVSSSYITLSWLPRCLHKRILRGIALFHGCGHASLREVASFRLGQSISRFAGREATRAITLFADENNDILGLPRRPRDLVLYAIVHFNHGMLPPRYGTSKQQLRRDGRELREEALSASKARKLLHELQRYAPLLGKIKFPPVCGGE